MTGARHTVVIVDDSEDVREYVELLCQNDGWRTVVCESASQGFEAVRREHPDLLITDVMLGLSSGLDLITRIRSDVPPPLPPIIVISGFDHFEGEALARGADAFLPKPFDWDTMRSTMTTVMQHLGPTPSEHDEAARRSHRMRAVALDAARLALARLRRDPMDLEQRGRWGALFLARYIGFGEAVIALMGDDHLQVFQSSHPEHWRRGDPFDLPMCRDILESNSTLVVPDLASLAARSRRPDGTAVRFFAGVPLRTRGTAVGMVCLLSERAGYIEAEDLQLLDYCGSRASALLSSDHPEVAPLFSTQGLITRSTLAFLIRNELARSRHDELALRLFLFAGRAPFLELDKRCALAELGCERYALLLSQGNRRDSWEEALARVHQIIDQTSPRAGILLSIENGVLGAFNADQILRSADAMIELRLQVGEGQIDQVVIRRHPLDPAPLPT